MKRALSGSGECSAAASETSNSMPLQSQADSAKTTLNGPAPVPSPVRDRLHVENTTETHKDPPMAPQTWLQLTLSSMKVHHSKLRLGPVDMSCAFSVSDARQDDMPLIYCSPTFERLTHYSLREIKGRNHRFMQDPSGFQEMGRYRHHTENEAVVEMMQNLKIGKECQVTLSNYVKGSKRWTNLLTMIPIVLNPEGIVDFIVGLQLDIDMFPQNVLKGNDGALDVDYRISLPVARPLKLVPEDEELPTIHELIENPTENYHHWSRFLRDEVIDIVLVLSLEGFLLEASRAIYSCLDYLPDTLIGCHMSSIMHRADYTQFMHELEVAGLDMPLSLLARMRHKSGTYRWIEFTGTALSLEESKHGTRIVLSGRQRYFLAGPGFGGPPRDNEFWSRVSPDGLVLFATSKAATILGKPLTHILGSHVAEFIPSTDLSSFKEALSAAQMGYSISLRHECLQNYGTVLKCVSDIYPGSNDSAIQTYLLMRTMTTDTEQTSAASASKSQHHSITTKKRSKDDTRRISLEPLPSELLASGLSTSGSTAWLTEITEAREINRTLRHALAAARNRPKQRKSDPSPAKGNAQVLQCSVCGTIETTQWRTGPKSVRLCNSCGLSWRKSMRTG